MVKEITFNEFLKKYSALSDDFIDDFCSICENDTEKFSIDLEMIAKWLGTTKGKLKETLTNTYNKKIDYIIKKEHITKKVSKSNKEIILLTIECFKRLCLMSHTKKGEQVRSYFIEMEKLLKKYKNYIIKEMRQTIEMLENNQREPIKNMKGLVYILQSPKDIDGIYRFGMTTEFKNRINNHNSSNSDKMKVIYIFETKYPEKVEKCVLAQIKELRYRKRKDFYEIDKDVLKELINDCEGFTLRHRSKIEKMQKGSGIKNNLYLYIAK